MAFYTYILVSEKTGRLYIGQTQHIDVRVEEHNSGKTKSTKNKGPWKLMYKKSFSTRKEAVGLEMKLKRWKSKIKVIEWIEKESSGKV